ncbi:uncharacterized protein LOC114673752 [Macaca mulatta]
MALKVQPPHPGLNHSNNNVTMVKVNVSMETPRHCRARGRFGGAGRGERRAESELGRYSGRLPPPAEPGRAVSSRTRDFPLKSPPQPARGRPRPPSPQPARARPRPRRSPPSPAAPRGLPGHREVGPLTSVGVLLQVLLEQREVCAEEREERPGQRPGARRDAPTARPPAPAAPPRAGTPRRPRPGRHSGRRRRAGGREEPPPPPGEQGATYPPSCGRPLLRGRPGIRGYMERREPGSRWTRAGGAAGRRRAGLAGARARGGPRARACRGRRGSRTPGPPAASRPACSSARFPGDRRSRLPPSPLPAGPRPGGARSHPRPKPPSSRALRTGARKLPPAGTLRRVPEPGRAGPPADRPLYWVTGLAHRPAGRSHLGGRAARGPRPIPRPARAEHCPKNATEPQLCPKVISHSSKFLRISFF